MPDDLRVNCCPECGRPMMRLRGPTIADRARWQCSANPHHRFGSLSDARGELAGLLAPPPRDAPHLPGRRS
ncbi:MAG TPA: hypothetical protein VHM02_02095 [Thermoanaerobaculia bacterium]|nr:hypothetical protein [Thermoanaerobaculia bacterium]